MEVIDMEDVVISSGWLSARYGVNHMMPCNSNDFIKLTRAEREELKERLNIFFYAGRLAYESLVSIPLIISREYPPSSSNPTQDTDLTD
jgi:hypothetical protein